MQTPAAPAQDPTPGIDAIRATAERIRPYTEQTPTIRYAGPEIDGLAVGELYVKLELLQRTGSFKPRGAINTLLQHEGELRGVTAFSAGNHAIATAYAAQQLALPATVVMPVYANAFRQARCRALGAGIELGNDIAALLDIVERLQRDQGLTPIHPFEGPHTVAGTATVGLELAEAIDSLDAVLVPVGGGGLIAGVASAIKQLQPGCAVYGIEPDGACGMRDSLAAGRPLDTVHVDTIADSLGAPLHMPLSFSLVQRHVDDVVCVSDEALRHAMRLMFTHMKLAVEPACAASLAALLGPLQSRLAGRRVAMIACGSNIDLDSFMALTR